MPTNATRDVIGAAIDLVERYGVDLTPENVRKHIDTNALTLGDASDALRKHINAQIPVVMKDRGLIIANAKTRARKDFWVSTPDDLEAQARIKEDSSEADVARLTADRAVVAFLREQEKAFGYEVYPELFQSDIDRIFSMHGIAAPRHKAAA